MENKKKNIVFMVIGAITLIVVTLGATYAYFTAQSSGGANIDTDVITGTTDNLSFSFGDLINIQATEENFGQGMGSISDSTTGTAILKANNTTNEATATYNIYLIIEANDFVYTTENQTPEIVLNVTDPNGNPVENITGLVHYENGFDITTRTGGFLLVPDYEISATDVQTIQDWNIEVTLVNLDSDQNANTNKTLTGRLYLTQEQMSSYELTQINNIDTETTYNSIDATLDLTNGSAAVSKYYYGIEKTSEALTYNDSVSLKRLSNTLASANDVEYIESDNPNYKFSNLEANTEYTIYSYVVDENKIKSNVYETNVTTAEYQIPTVDTVGHSVTLNSISLTVNASNGSNEIVKYMYSKDNGNSWEESTSNIHTFNNLTDSTQYNIKVKVVDSEGVESTEYYEAITTEIYILPVVASVNATTTWNSITLTPTGTNGTNTIDHYEYSINNGAYQISNVFSNLTDNTNYTIRVKAIDTVGRESNVYETTVRTDAYRLPTISVTTSSTTNSITINVNATPGDGSIVSYHYSRDNGSNYITSTGNSYTFSGLTSGTIYYLRVYVTDSNGRTSTVYTTSQATTYINPSVSNVSASNITSDSITINVTASGGSNSISRYYYSSNSGSTWENSTSSSYTFTGLSAGTTYNFRVYVMDIAGHSSSQSSVSATTEKGTLANYIINNVYTGTDGDNDLYYHDGIGSYTNSDQEAGDNSYRYSGANPNNYVCFGIDVVGCTNDNLYRIVGVFNGQVKLIKYDYANSNLLGTNYGYIGNYGVLHLTYKGIKSTIDSYYWSSVNVNLWDISDLNGVLNLNYLNNIGSKWSEMIATTSWKVGGIAMSDINEGVVRDTIKLVYQNEIVSPAESTTYSAKVGLMYVSDYGYAASPKNWKTSLYDYFNIAYNDNWMHMGLFEWTITRRSNDLGRVFQLNSTGNVLVTVANANQGAVRPAFYLNSDVIYISGSGTQTDPFRIA